jgi:DNA processing protein
MLGVGVAGPGGPRERGSPGIEEPVVRATTPEAADAERDAWAVLAAVDGLGPIGFAALLGCYGTAQAVLADAARPGGTARLVATPTDLQDERRHRDHPIDAKVAARIAATVQDAPRLLARLRALDLRVLTLEEPAYPTRLAGVQLPPSVLFVRGDPAALRLERAAAVVGTRRPTGLGRAIAGRIARGLVGAGAAVVSGLAYGIDGAAHEAAVRAGGTTIAVIGGGHAHRGPRAHDQLADTIVATGGAVVSEYAPDVRPSVGTFPRRNRIISGLSDATIVVEAPARSGALITASWAMEQGRGVFVVPGPLDAPASEGCLALLREFGTEVRVVAGVPHLVADLGYGSAPVPGRGRGASANAVAGVATNSLGAVEQTVARAILGDARTVDAIVATTDLPVATVLATLTLLEARGFVTGRHGRYHADGDLVGPSALPIPR